MWDLLQISSSEQQGLSLTVTRLISDSEKPSCYQRNDELRIEIRRIQILTKTIKTPLMIAVAFGPTSYSSVLVLKSKLLHSPKAHYGFVPKPSLHGGKNIALRAEKPILVVRCFFSGAQRNGFFPMKRSYVAKQCVVISWFVLELAHRHKP